MNDVRRTAFMIRESMRKKWQPIIDGYQAENGTIKDYCTERGVSRREFHKYRKLLKENDERHYEQIQLLPVTVMDPVRICLRINGLPLSYNPDQINDKELGRILRLCRDL